MSEHCVTLFKKINGKANNKTRTEQVTERGL